jgi:hypothetical protein
MESSSLAVRASSANAPIFARSISGSDERTARAIAASNPDRSLDELAGAA